MKLAKMLPDGAAVQHPVNDRWYVTDGAVSVGPVELDLIARGFEAGKVPAESLVRNEAWTVWRPLVDVVGPRDREGLEVASDVDDDLDPVFDPTATRRGAPLPCVPWLLALATDDVAAPARAALPEEWSPADALAGAADAKDALLLLLTAAVQRSRAEGAIVHEMHDDGPVAVCAHGPGMFNVLGGRTRLHDPAVVAAAAGAVVWAEPDPGPAGQAVIARLALLGVAATGAVMIPIRRHGRLYGMLEVGRQSAFRAGDVVALEELVDALVVKLEHPGWG